MKRTIVVLTLAIAGSSLSCGKSNDDKSEDEPKPASSHTLEDRDGGHFVGSSQPGVPEGCGDVLVMRETDVRCVSDARCEAVRTQPDRKVHWSLFVDQYRVDAHGDQLPVDEDEFAQRRDCLVRYLDSTGVRAMPSTDGEEVELDASHDQVASALEFSVVQGYDLGCGESGCDRCAGLSEKACKADAFCAGLEGDKLNEAGDCFEPTIVACTRGDIGCGGVIYTVERADGCWRFSGCMAEGWTASESSTCNLAAFANLAACAR